jgi:hypothetical protein
VGGDVGVHAISDHRAHQYDADEDAAEDSCGYEKLDSSHNALRLMTHRHACKTDDAASVFRSLRAIAVDKNCAPLSRACYYAPLQRGHNEKICMEINRNNHSRERLGTVELQHALHSSASTATEPLL